LCQAAPGDCRGCTVSSSRQPTTRSWARP
jgi:hypothetical protein